MHKNELEFHQKIIMSDEAYFHLEGYIKKQNSRICGSKNPKMIIEKPLYPQRVTVWCGFWAGGIIGPYWAVFKNTKNGLVFSILVGCGLLMKLSLLFRLR